MRTCVLAVLKLVGLRYFHPIMLSTYFWSRTFVLEIYSFQQSWKCYALLEFTCLGWTLKWMYLMTSSSCCCPHKTCDLLKQSPMTSGWCCAETSPLTSRTFSSWRRTDESGHGLFFWERPRIALATTLTRKLQRPWSALFCITCTGGQTGQRR